MMLCRNLWNTATRNFPISKNIGSSWKCLAAWPDSKSFTVKLGYPHINNVWVTMGKTARKKELLQCGIDFFSNHVHSWIATLWVTGQDKTGEYQGYLLTVAAHLILQSTMSNKPVSVLVWQFIMCFLNNGALLVLPTWVCSEESLVLFYFDQNVFFHSEDLLAIQRTPSSRALLLQSPQSCMFIRFQKGSCQNPWILDAQKAEIRGLSVRSRNISKNSS